MKDIINSTYPDRINLKVEGIGDTLNLFQDAKKLVATSANSYKHVWVVFDTDDFPADHINKTAQYCIEESTEDTIYHAIGSNQCIEKRLTEYAYSCINYRQKKTHSYVACYRVSTLKPNIDNLWST